MSRLQIVRFRFMSCKLFSISGSKYKFKVQRLFCRKWNFKIYFSEFCRNRNIQIGHYWSHKAEALESIKQVALYGVHTARALTPLTHDTIRWGGGLPGHVQTYARFPSYDAIFFGGGRSLPGNVLTLSHCAY